MTLIKSVVGLTAFISLAASIGTMEQGGAVLPCTAAALLSLMVLAILREDSTHRAPRK